jgi:hypothetical protein
VLRPAAAGARSNDIAPALGPPSAFHHLRVLAAETATAALASPPAPSTSSRVGSYHEQGHTLSPG